MNIDEIVSSLILELRRGVVVLLVLSQLKKPKYGYMLVQRLSDSGMDIPANTLYPLMRRLEKQGLLSSFWDTGESKPRKYYQITDGGIKVYDRLCKHWRDSESVVNALIGGEDNE